MGLRVRGRLHRRRVLHRARGGRWGWAAAAAGLVLVAAAGGGAWVSLREKAAPATAQLTALVRHRLERPAPPAPPELQDELTRLAEKYREPVGVAVTDVKDGWTAQVDGLSPYPQQSVAKLWTAIAVLDAVDHGRLALEQQTLLTAEDRSLFYEPVADRIGQHGFQTTIYDLLDRALTESDNAAYDALTRRVGGPPAVAQVLAVKNVRGISAELYEREMQARAAGLEWKPELWGWRFKAAREKLPDEVRDQALAAYLADPPDGAAPAAITHALARLARGELLSKASTTVMLDLMANCRTGGRRLKGGLPPGWSIGHKTGTGPDWRGASVGINDVGLITAPDGRMYAVAVMMRETRKPIAERMAFMQAVSRAVVKSWSARDRQTAVEGERPNA